MTGGAAGPGLRYEDLASGMSAEYARTLGEREVVAFTDLTGDANPVHLDEAYAARSFFRGRVVPGMLTASLIATVIANRLPGPGCIYLDQKLRFVSPVRLGETVTARVTVARLVPERRVIELATGCAVGPRAVIEGEATVYLPP